MDLVRKFREQIHGLGVLWVFIGLLTWVVVVVAIDGNPNLAARVRGGQHAELLLIPGLGLAWCVLGVLTCLKQMWAVYVALVLTYLGVMLQLLYFNFCGAVLGVLVIVQAHRVIGWADQLRASGLPLTARPQPPPGGGR